MCFYDKTTFTCGDYKFGDFRAYCSRETSFGQFCPLRMAYHGDSQSTLRCRTCSRIVKETRRMLKLEALIGQDGQADGGEAEEIKLKIEGLVREIEYIESRRSSKLEPLKQGVRQLKAFREEVVRILEFE